jgi:hypothetical protein
MHLQQPDRQVSGMKNWIAEQHYGLKQMRSSDGWKADGQFVQTP